MQRLSVVIPVFNEVDNINRIFAALSETLSTQAIQWEIIFVNDGSTDGSAEVLENLAQAHPEVSVVEFSRNFGKETALTAGLHAAQGDAAIMMDADLQHPPQLIPQFIEAWKAGSEVVIGIRTKSIGQSTLKRAGSYLFYAIMNAIAETKVTPSATDFRLLDRAVIEAFKQLTEKERITRGLIDWLGFRRSFIPFEAPPRASGNAAYSMSKLIRLALSSFISMSLFPLKLAGYLGIIITLVSGIGGVFVIIERFIMHDPWGFQISYPAILAIVNLFLVGVMLSCLGLISLYIATIHREVTGRPLYVVRKQIKGKPL